MWAESPGGPGVRRRWSGQLAELAEREEWFELDLNGA
jgi:hypothetical protein